MTSDELAAIRQRFKELVGDGPVVKWGESWMNASINLIPVMKDVDALLATVEEQQVPPSRHQKECERLLAENEELKKQVERLRMELTETGTRPPPQIDRSVTMGRSGNEAHP